MKQELLRMERVTYLEDEVVKLEDFYLQIYQGEIMGLLPINSHGLSSLLKLLQDNLPIFDGYIYYNGEQVNSWRESRRTHNRISVIQAKSSLVEQLTVTDNIFVMRHGFRQELIRTKLMNRQLEPVLEEIGIHIPVDTRIENLTVFERVIVELLRAVIMGNRLIVLYEVGALISYEELAQIHKILEYYRKKGFTFLYVCSHMEELSGICDRVARLSNGRIQKIIEKNEMEEEIYHICPEEYSRMIRSYLENYKKSEKKEEILQWKEWGELHRSSFSFRVNRGECLVLQLTENDRFQQISEVLTGKREAEEDLILMEGNPVKLFQDSRIGVVEELPTKTMIFAELDYMENLCMSLARRMPFLWLNDKIRGNIRQEYGKILGEDVFFTPVEDLSEKQKYQLVYTRVLLQKPQVVFCINPFKGADVAHRMFIWQMLETLLKQGTAIVIVSVSLSDSLALADRLLIVEETGQVKEVLREDFAKIPQQVIPWTRPYGK